MQARVNCKKKPIDYDGNYRAVIRSRFRAKKTFDADYKEVSTGVQITENSNAQLFMITPDMVERLAFFLDGDRPYLEIVTAPGTPLGGFSFLIGTIADNHELDQAGVVEFLSSIDGLSTASGVPIMEFIDPNPVGLCPDGMDPDMDTLIALRLAEGADILYQEREADIIAADMPQMSFADADLTQKLNEYAPTGSAMNDWEDMLSKIDGLYSDFDLNPETAPSAPAHPVSAALQMPSLIPQQPSAAELENMKRSAEDAVDGAYEVLNGLRHSLEDEKNRRLREIQGLYAQMPGESVSALPIDIASVSDASIDVPPFESNYAYQAPERIVSNDPEIVSNVLSRNMESLIADAEDFESHLDEYDSVIAGQRAESNRLLQNFAADHDADVIIRGLIEMCQSQVECADKMNSRLKKEQVLKNHAVKQREEAYAQIEAQNEELDQLRRSLRFAEESKQRSDAFVEAAKTQIRKVIADAREKVDAAMNACNDMNERMDQMASELRRVEAARDAAFTDREHAIKALEQERNNSQALIEAFDDQLDGFTKDTVAKVQTQIERAEIAERELFGARSRIAELESELNTALSSLTAYQSAYQRSESEVRALNDQLAQANEDYTDLAEVYTQVEAERNNTGAVLSQTEAEMLQRVAEADKVSEQLAALKIQYEQAIAERNSVLADRDTMLADATRQAQEQINAVAAERDALIIDAYAARDAAVAANNLVLDELGSAILMKSGFGRRRKKLVAIRKAWNNFLDATQPQTDKEAVIVQDGTYEADMPPAIPPTQPAVSTGIAAASVAAMAIPNSSDDDITYADDGNDPFSALDDAPGGIAGVAARAAQMSQQIASDEPFDLGLSDFEVLESPMTQGNGAVGAVDILDIDFDAISGDPEFSFDDSELAISDNTLYDFLDDDEDL